MSPNPDCTASLAVLRAAQQHHVNMSAMADVRASFLLMTAILTLAITGPQAVHDPHQWGLIALAITSLIVGILSALAGLGFLDKGLQAKQQEDNAQHEVD